MNDAARGATYRIQCEILLYPVKALAPSIEMPTRSDQLTHSEAMSTLTASDLSLPLVLCRRD